MDVAALSLAVDSSAVVKATNDLDQFTAASERAGKAGGSIGSQSGSIAKLVASVQSMDRKLSAIVSGLDKVNAALSTNAKAAQGAAAANDNAARAIGVADAHVIAYTQNLARLAATQGDANAHVVAYQQAMQGSAAPQVQLNAHVEAYRRHLAALPPALDQATRSAGALQANTGNIAAQFQDIGVTAAMGMNPLIIGLQQGTQLSAVFAQSGGTMRDVLVGAFRQIASAQALLTIGLVALVAVAIQLAMAWYNSKSEAEALAERIGKLKVSSDNVSSAQTTLGGVFDLTTGKMKDQSAAAIALARAQLVLQRATAQGESVKAARELDTSGNLGFMGRLGAWVKGNQTLIEGSARVDALTKAYKAGQIGVGEAQQGFEQLYKKGAITNEMYVKGTVAASNYATEVNNVATATKGLADLERGRLSDTFINRSNRTPQRSAPTAPPRVRPTAVREQFNRTDYSPSALLADEQNSTIESSARRLSEISFPDIDRYFERLNESINASRDVAKGFFQDWIGGVREGANVFMSFADGVINALNRIIDKLLNNVLDGFLNSISQNALSRLFGSSASATASVTRNAIPNALGGVYGSPQRFANGGAFTNSIVDTPTLFRFANGGALGEMGEAGPEAIMPLKRGLNGALGVQVNGGGKPAIRMGDYNPTYMFEGAVGLDGIASMVRQGGEATYNQMKRDLQTLLQQLDTDGAFAS